MRKALAIRLAVYNMYSRRFLQSYANGIGSIPLRFETTGECLQRAVDRKPDKEFLVFRSQKTRKTFAQLYEDSRRFACGLFSLGLQKGDRVGVWGHNHYEWTVAQFATAMAGMIQVNINPSYQSEELAYALRTVGVRAVLMPETFKKKKYMDAFFDIDPLLAKGQPGLGTVKSTELPHLQHIIVFGNKSPVAGAWSMNDIWNGAGSQDRKTLEEVETTVYPDDPVNIQYTSGTTGNPKAATLTHHNILNNAFMAGYTSGFDKEDHRICIPNPLYHCFGCVLGVANALNHTQTCIFPEVNYDLKRIFEAIHEEKCTFVYGTPTMFLDMVNSSILKDYDMSSLKGSYIAGAPCPSALCEQMIEKLHQKDVFILYGSTELSPLVTMSRGTDPLMERIKSVGYTLPHTEVCIVDEKGKVVPRGQKGELLARGYMTMRGYWGDEERTKKDLTPDRWYHTGDTSYMDENGAVHIVGRSKDMICRGGENIYPTEIEQFMFKLPFVADVQIIGVPDERYGETVCAWVRLKDDFKGKVTPEQIQKACKDKIAHYKVPKYVLIKEQHEFPLTATGKVKKFELRDISRKLLGLENVKSHFDT